MIRAVRSFFTPPVFENDEDKSRAVIVLYRILTGTYILLPFAALAWVFNPAIAPYFSANVLIVTGLSTFLIGFAKRGHVQAAGITLITYMLVISTVADVGMGGELHPMSILLGAVIVMSGLLLGSNGAWIAAIIIGLKHALVLTLLHSGWIAAPDAMPGITPFVNGISTLASYLLIALLFGMASNSIYTTLKRAQRSESELQTSNRRLQELTQNLEERIMERTRDLEKASATSERRASQFESLAHIASAITTIQNLQELLPRIAEVISEQLGFYHVGIFLVEPSGRYAVLSAANSEGGRKMIQRRHQLKIGEQGIVGYVTQTGKPRIALDVGEDSVYFTNPELPDTHSEMALPLRTGNEIIGALDIQSTEVGAFTDEDFQILSTLANQVSLAIQNARHFDQSQKALAELESVERQYIRETWKRLPKQEKLDGYRYSITGAIPLEPGKEDENSRRNGQEFSVPILLRGETIGTLTVQPPKGERINQDQMDLVRAVAERVAISAENARLFDETARRAERERIVSDITSKIGASFRTESILRATASELSQALDDAEVFISLNTDGKGKKEADGN